MNQSTAKSERITAVISTLVAVAILAAGVTAHQSHTALQDELVLLESDLRFQLNMAFRHAPKQRARRMALLEEVMKGWQRSPRSEEDRMLLASWLLEATIRSMPGSNEELPDIPQFGPTKATTPTKPVENELKQPTAGQTASPAQETPKSVPAGGLPIPLAEEPTSDVAADESTNPFVHLTKTDAVKPVSQESPAEKKVKFNLTKLATRIAGYHKNLDQVENALLTTEKPDLRFLATQLQRLDKMSRDFRFVKLYYAALSDKERQTVPPLRSMEATLAEIERLLQQVESGADTDFFASFDLADYEQLAKLRRKLETIVSLAK